MAQLAEKRKKEAANKARAERDAAQQAENQTGETDRASNKGVRSPSLEIEEETNEKIEMLSVLKKLPRCYVRRTPERQCCRMEH